MAEPEPPRCYHILGEKRFGILSTIIRVQEDEGNRVLCLKQMRKSPHTSDHNREALAELACYKQLQKMYPSFPPVGVMSLQGAFQDAHSLYLAMPWRQCCLNDVTKGALSRETWCHHVPRWVAQLATGLNGIHRAGIVHRDLKSMNVVLDEYLNVEIIDFGQSYISAPNQVNTSVSRIAGSSLWMAPELRAARTDSIAGRSVNLAGKKVDFWSLGAIIYDLLASAGDSGKGWCLEVADHVHAHPGDVHTVIAPIESPRARDMIAGLLAHDSTKRYGYKDVAEHPFFYVNDRVSQFEELARKALEKVDLEAKWVRPTPEHTIRERKDAHFANDTVGTAWDPERKTIVALRADECRSSWVEGWHNVNKTVVGWWMDYLPRPNINSEDVSSRPTKRVKWT